MLEKLRPDVKDLLSWRSLVLLLRQAVVDWREREGKTVALQVVVRLDSVVFVRLLRPLGGGADFPVPHRAVRVEDGSKDASCKDVGLEQMQPPGVVRESEDTRIESLLGSSVNQ